METSERILKKADEMFLKYGFRSVSMDDLAKALSISKKTIYQHYKDKDTLINTVVSNKLEHDKESFEEIKSKSKNALEEMIALSDCVQSAFSDVNPAVILDAQKYYPKAWDLINQHKTSYIMLQMEDNLRRGIEEGLYRKDINIKALARLRVEQNQIAFNFDLFPPDEYNFIEVLLWFLEHFLRGVVTQKGFDILENTSTFK